MVVNEKECLEIQELLDDFLSEELSVDTGRRVLTHLDKCPRCDSEKSHREKLREAMRRAWGSVHPPADVAEKIRRSAEASASRRTALTRFTAVAAGLLFVVALYFLLPDTRSGGEVVDHFQVVAEDHLHCAGRPADLAAAALDGGLAEVGDRLLNHPAAYRLVAVMDCRLDGKAFVHYIFRGDTGRLSLMMEERSPSQTLPPKAYRFVTNGVEFSTSREGPLTVTAMAVSGRFVYFVGDDLDVDDIHRIARQIAAPLTKALAGKHGGT
jgi:hypothetical protein